jgi:hypothetical protein
MQKSMREKAVAIGVILILLVVVCIAAGALWFGVQTGRAIDEQERDNVETTYDARGFIGYCDEEQCVTLPTLLQKGGGAWQLGFYKVQQDVGGEPRLAYRNAAGKLMTMEEMFAEE